MKYLTILILTFLISVTPLSTLQAQNTDKERIKRYAEIQSDINILEGVLEEMFKARWEANGNVVRIGSGSFTFRNSNNINGSYLENYGVIFRIPSEPPAFVFSTDAEGETSSFYFQTGNGEEKVTEESIINRIKDFLGDYGSTIELLADDEKVTVMYESNRAENSFSFQVLSSSGKKEDQTPKKQLPSKIIVSATKADLLAYRRGSISEQQFDNRLNLQTVEKENAGKQDINIMANILKAAFEETEADAFNIRGSVNHTYLEDLGVLFYINLSLGSSFNGLGEALVTIRKKLSAINFDSLKLDTLSMNNDEEQKMSKKDWEKAYNQFVNQLKETIIDYGGTLKSVPANEYLNFSITIPPSPSISGMQPQAHLQIQLKKSVLEQLNKGNISRSEAIEQITTMVVKRFGEGGRSYKIPHVPVSN